MNKKIEKCINDEPELEDGMTQKMWDVIKKACAENDKELVEEFCRIIVRETKKGILKRLKERMNK